MLDCPLQRADYRKPIPKPAPPIRRQICFDLCEVRAVRRGQDTEGRQEVVGLSLCVHHRAPLMAARQPADEQQQEDSAEPPMDVDAVQQLQSGDEPDGEDNEEGGVMADGSESGGGMQDDSDDGGMLDEDQDQDDENGDSEWEDDSDLDSDGHDDGYEEEGHPVVPITSADGPDGFLGADELEARFPLGTNEATKSLALGVIGRTIPSAQHVTDLIEQGANPNIMPRLKREGTKHRGFRYLLLAIAIDSKSDFTVGTIQAEDDNDDRPVALPQWSSDELQAAVLTALLDGGADTDAAADRPGETPLQLATACGNRTAFELLMARQDIDLRSPGPRMVMMLPRSLRPPPLEYLQLLLSMYERLVARDPTLAAERDIWGYSLVHRAAEVAGRHYPQPFISSYLDLIRVKGADMTAGTIFGCTPLHYAAACGSPYVADYLCRKLPAADIDRRENNGQTPLATAAEELDRRTQRLQDPDTPEAAKEKMRAESDKYKLTIRSLLRAGADINLIPTATEERHRQRQLVLTEYGTVLNEVGPAVMSAVNAALAPHRSLAALLTPRLAVGPQEAPIFGWHIASYLFDMDAAQETISEAIGVRHSDMARRVCAAAKLFVKSAVYQASSNREVVGGTTNVGGQVVRVPQLQCFVVGGVGGREMELREVVQRAILDEATKWGLAGDIDNGFSKDVAAVVWGAVGCVDKGRDGRQTFTPLRMT
ncbi:unnamed protein product [Vitrella brassicaformis CCMP3155]|uniref:Uncharacterized protein n=1 Tax=Vitrella brassicaformis (strain CCMP3155) TaxID=1169540 RepID=A0A0G4EUS2_VITBC|nr:unnamed protein product [Vitrella brassicaformis CCMP3155]|eukprot:CEM02081.1 unnamed protein product [Vitrella brassicaformis CCMP3155]